jgi:hypothetical protein
MELEENQGKMTERNNLEKSLDRIAAGLVREVGEANRAEHAALVAGVYASYVRTGVRVVQSADYLNAVRCLRSTPQRLPAGPVVSGTALQLRRILAGLRHEIRRRRALREFECLAEAV